MDKKIARWARTGQLAFLGCDIFKALNQIADPSHVSNPVSDIEFATACGEVVCLILFTNALVKIISGFATILNNKQK